MKKKLMSLNEGDREAIRQFGSPEDKRNLDDFQKHCNEVCRLMYVEVEVPRK